MNPLKKDIDWGVGGSFHSGAKGSGSNSQRIPLDLPQVPHSMITV